MHAAGATIARWSRSAPPRPPAIASKAYAIYPVSSAEIMELVACDAPRSGEARGPRLAALMAEHPHRAFVAVERATGAFSGHAFGTDQGVALLVADAPDAAAWLLHAVERAGAPGRAWVAEANEDAVALFRAAGYTREDASERDAGEARGRQATQYVVEAPRPQ